MEGTGSGWVPRDVGGDKKGPGGTGRSRTSLVASVSSSSVYPSLVCPSQVIKEVSEFYRDTYNKLKSKDEPQRKTLKAIHYAVRLLRKRSFGTRAHGKGGGAGGLAHQTPRLYSGHLPYSSLSHPVPALPSAVELLWYDWRSGTVHLRHLPPEGCSVNRHREGKLASPHGCSGQIPPGLK